MDNKDEKLINVAEFSKTRIKDLEDIYSDSIDARNRYNKSSTYAAGTYKNASEIRKALNDAISNKETIVQSSKKYYATNPLYASIVDYFANMFLWRYSVIPHKINNTDKKGNKKDYSEMYSVMLDVVEGLNIEKKFPSILTQLFVEGASYFTTYCDNNSLTIDTIMFPSKYCRRVGETQFGTAIIQLDYTYFTSFGLSTKELEDFLLMFPPEIQIGFQTYKKDAQKRWQQLDPHYSSCIMLNEKGIPNTLYSLGSILTYEKYSDNELERNENKLKYIVVHKMPIYEDQLIFDTTEVKAIHKNLAKIVNTSDRTRLITTYGDVKLERIQDGSEQNNTVLEDAFKAVYDNAAINHFLFVGDSVRSLDMSIIRDKSRVWNYVDQLINFYNIVINNWFNFGDYQADLKMLQISQYTYEADIKLFKENATLGVGKLDFIIASGIKQKNLQDTFDLETYLKLEQIKPLQTSYTQTNTDGSNTKKTPEQKETSKKEQVQDEVKEKDKEELDNEEN